MSEASQERGRSATRRAALPLGRLLAALGLACAAALAVAVLAEAARASVYRAETRYLALLLFAGTLPLLVLHALRRAALARGPALVTGLCLLAAIALPPDPARGLALCALLAAFAAWSLPGVASRADLPTWVVAGVALAALTSPRALLLPAAGLLPVAGALLAGVAGGAAAWLIARAAGPARALLVLAHALLTAGSLAPVGTLGVVAVAAGALPRRLAAVAAALALAPLLLVPSPLAVLLTTTSAAWWLRRHGGGRFVVPLLLVACGVSTLFPTVREWHQVAPALLLVAALLPGPLAATTGVGFAPRQLAPTLAAAAALAAMALRVVPGEVGDALVPVGLWLALALGDTGSTEQESAQPPAAYSLVLALLLALALVPVGYPLLRSSAMAAFHPPLTRPVIYRTVHAWPPRSLAVDAPALEVALAAATAAPRRLDATLDHIVLDTTIVHGAELPFGTVAATVSVGGTGLAAAAGGLQPWPLRVGIDTAEWTAGAGPRPLPAPPPALSWVSGDLRFFGQRYRARLPVPAGTTARTLVIERAPSLPARVQLVVYHVAVAER